MSSRSGRRGIRWPDIFLSTLAMLLCVGKVSAGGDLFEVCVDSRGRSAATTIDHDLSFLALAEMENGSAVVRYNPGQLPGMAPRARLFSFAHECTPLAAGQTLGDRSIGPARRADCSALATLLRSGELAAPEADWAVELAALGRAVPRRIWCVRVGLRRTMNACGNRG